MSRRSYLVRFLKRGKPFSVRHVNAASPEAARAEAQRRIDEGGVIGIEEGSRGDYVFGRPDADITVGYVVESGEPCELADRDLLTERHKKGLGPPPSQDPKIPF